MYSTCLILSVATKHVTQVKTGSEKRQPLRHNLSGAGPVIFLLSCQIIQIGSAESLMRTPLNELRVLEELHYHSIHDSRYISEIQTALIEQGIDGLARYNSRTKLKDTFKQTDFYKYGVIYLNDQVPKDYQHVQSFDDLANLSVKQKNYEYTIHTGSAGETTVMADDTTPRQQNGDGRDIPIVDIEQNILRSAIARNPFFAFASLKRYCPHLTSVREFMTSENYLGSLAITFKGNLSVWTSGKGAAQIAPALLTMMSSRPYAFTTWATRLSASAGFEAS